MAQSLVLKAKGIYTNYNELSEVPEGSMSIANNVVIDKEGVVETRRGFAKLLGQFSSPSDRALNLFTYQDQLLAHYTGNKLAYYNSGTDAWVDYAGSYDEPDATFGRIRGVSANQNFYFVTSVGVKKLDIYSGTPILAGGIKALDGQASLTGATGFMADNTQVAYRIIWGYKDLNNNLILGSPSQRITVANTSGGTRDVNVSFTIPDGITTDYFYQIYRSAMSASATDEGDDEMGLVYEDNPTAGEITAKLATVLDNTPDDLRGATIYTADSQEGIAQSNEIPPFAKDIAVFRNSTFFGNTRTRQRLTITLTAVGGTDGFQLNDTITIAGTTYTAKAVENIAALEFQLSTGGTAAQNIADTALSLIRVINRNTTNDDVYAYYLSGFTQLPGKMLIEERASGGASFAATVSARGDAWNPVLPTSGTSVSSTNDSYANGLYFSKNQQPESVPLVNFLRIGSADQPILRILPIRDALFILKTDGVFRLTGTDTSSFRVDLLDNTVTLQASESAVVLNNQIFMLTEQGVATCSDTGVSIVSRPIENTLLDLLAEAKDQVSAYSFGVSYESDRKYILFLPSTADDTYATQAYVFNTATSTWVRWDLSKGCGIVRSFDNKLYLGDALDNAVNIERKTRDFTDYVDDQFTVSITAFTGKVLTLSSLASIDVGDVISQSSTQFTVVRSVDTNAGTVTVRDTITWVIGAATILKAIKSEVEFLPQSGKNAGILKQYRDISGIFKNALFSNLSMGFKSELSETLEQVELTGLGNGLYGLIPWGSGPWGGGAKAFPIRTYVPANKQRCSQLTVRLTLQEGYSFFRLNGISLIFNTISERLRR